MGGGTASLEKYKGDYELVSIDDVVKPAAGFIRVAMSSQVALDFSGNFRLTTEDGESTSDWIRFNTFEVFTVPTIGTGPVKVLELIQESIGVYGRYNTVDIIVRQDQTEYYNRKAVYFGQKPLITAYGNFRNEGLVNISFTNFK